MAKTAGPIVIKKYANRRLYHTGTSAYVTLDDLADMVRRGEEFQVQDAKSGENITRGVLGQIIFDREARGSGLLPIAFLRQLITFYGDQMQGLVPTYLEQSLATFAREQHTMRKELNDSFGPKAFDLVQDQVRANMDLFQRSMRMFMPFGANGPDAPAPQTAQPRESGAADLASDVAALKGELAKMQARLDAMSPAAGEEERGESEVPLPPTIATARGD